MSVVRPIKEIDQLANLNASEYNPYLVVIGSMMSSDGQTGILSYNDNISELIDIVNNWATLLIFLYNDSRFNPWVNTSLGQLKINEFNFNYSQLTPVNQNVQVNQLLTNYNSILGGFKYQFNTNFDILSTIGINSMDGKKFLNQSDGSLAAFNVMLNNIQTFYNTIILNISGMTLSNLSTQINSLVKYNNTFVTPIPFTV